MKICSACGKPVKSPYQEGKEFFCPSCWEDSLRRLGRKYNSAYDALDNPSEGSVRAYQDGIKHYLTDKELKKEN